VVRHVVVEPRPQVQQVQPQQPVATPPTYVAVPAATAAPLPKVLSPGGEISSFSAPPAPGTPTAAPAASAAPATSTVTTTTTAPAIAPAASSGSGGPAPGGAGPTAFLGVVLAAGFIGAVELRDRRRTA